MCDSVYVCELINVLSVLVPVAFSLCRPQEKGTLFGQLRTLHVLYARVSSLEVCVLGF